MNKHPLTRELLEQAAASLDQVAKSFNTVVCTIDGRLASIDAGDDWQAHPTVPGTQMRRIATPTGAPYQMLEVRSQAGAHAKRVIIDQATDTHVLSGQLAIGRDNKPLEYYGTGTCCRYAAGEPHSYQVLQDSHNLIIFHNPSFLQTNGKQ